ncbi:adenylyltransferase/cytidyltransferase family protein [Robiginitalea sediminis]|uniref:adenylyltransferase/cytidyltransferase family protein n=1 Tax=Robiginitalea sediminis TaxID=1982593 RepID=UPI0018E9156D|nr:adenylyltransferase/cytidyltransferase family protein [Robiginitalea sediminis]
MDGKAMEALAKRFPGWEFVVATPSGWRISATDDRAATQASELVGQLRALNPEGDLEIRIHGSQPIIDLLERKAKKYRRMYTSGCFDVFHFGHLNILEQSKALCEYLIVGVSTDELIEKEKGRRPVIPYEERARVLEAISYVDQVIPQVDKDKQKVVDAYRIDAISVGDDWKGRYPKVSCQMEYFPYTKSISSTILKDTLNLTLHPKA